MDRESKELAESYRYGSTLAQSGSEMDIRHGRANHPTDFRHSMNTMVVPATSFVDSKQRRTFAPQRLFLSEEEGYGVDRGGTPRGFRCRFAGPGAIETPGSIYRGASQWLHER